MADKDFRIDLILGAKFAEGFRAIDEAKRKLEGAERAAGRFNRAGLSVGAALRTAGYAGIAAASGAVAVMGLYIQKTIEAEKVQAQLQSRLADTAGVAGRTLAQLNEQSKALSHVTVFDDEAIGNAQAMLLTFTQIRGVNFDRTVEAALNLATAMGTDATDAAKTLGKALSDPAKGLDQLRRVGVTFTDAERENIQAMVEHGRVADAQAAILDKLKSKMGTAATAARNTLGGALQALKNAFDDVLEGDSGDAGIVGTRNAIESLIKTLNDPATRAGTQALISDLVAIANAAITAAAKVGNMIAAIRENYFAGTLDQSTTLLRNRRTDLETQLFRAQRRSGNGLADGPDPIGKLLGIAQGKDGQIADLQRQISEIDAEITRRNKAAAQDASRQRGKDFQNVVGGVNLGALPNPAPEGEGVSTVKVPRSGGGGSKADPDAGAKARLADLKQELALLGQIKDGETEASEAAKARYDTTEGEYKNASPALKAQIVAAAEALDAAKAHREEIQKTTEDYKSLREELRTPAEVALDEAIAKVNTLDAAMRDGIATKADYDEAQARIVKGLIADQPDFQGLAPEVGGAFGEILKLDQAADEEKKWYEDSLKRLDDYRARKNADLEQAAKEQETIKSQHEARMQQIEQSRQVAGLQLASTFFGQIAQLQNSQNAKAARIGKAAAIAQAIINTYQAATEAYKAMAGIPVVGPALGVAAAAAAVAAGLANVAAIRAQPTGYATGGRISGPGTGTSDSVLIRASNDEFMVRAASARQPGAYQFLEDFNRRGMAAVEGLRGFAEGGRIDGPALTPPDWGSYPQGSIAFKGGENRLSLYNLFDLDTFVQKIANHPAMEERMVVIAGDNGTAIRGRWGGS